jgi:nucleotide-binding universal stress UspA family protein
MGERALESAREVSGIYGLQPVLQLLEGETPGTLLRYAHEVAADFVVLGTRGRSVPATMLLGSTALETIRKSNRPVIVVPPHATSKFLDIHTIAVALDGTAPSHRAFKAATVLARACGASLELGHVIDLERVAQSQYADAISYAAQVLAAAALEAADANVNVRKRVLEGDRAGALTAWVESNGCELLAMGSHGRAGTERLLLGSVTEAVLRVSTVPVLVHA